MYNNNTLLFPIYMLFRRLVEIFFLLSMEMVNYWVLSTLTIFAILCSGKNYITVSPSRNL